MELPTAVVAKDEQGNPKVSLRGDVDFRNAWVVTDAVHLAGRDTGELIVMDLGALTFIDSSGISALVRAARAMREQGRRLRLAQARPHVIQILRTAGFTRYFEFDPSENGAMSLAAAEGGGDRIWQHTAFTIPARYSLISYVRGKVAEMVESVPGGDVHLDAIRLAVGEAASNAVRHGCAGREELRVAIECFTDGETLYVEITDPGPGFDPDEVPTPQAGELREGGMGIHFMRLTMDEVTYYFDGRGTTVRLRKRLLAPDVLASSWNACGQVRAS